MKKTIIFQEKSQSPNGFIVHKDSFTDARGYVERFTMMEETGKAMVVLHKYQEDPTFYLYNISIEESHRKQGLGNSILKMCEAIALQFGLTATSLYVEKGSWMESWYKRKGYVYMYDMGGSLNMVWLKKELS